MSNMSLKTILIILIITELTLSHQRLHPLFCYQQVGPSPLADILDTNIPRNKGIFLIETSCLSKHFQQITLERRQLCALESVAKTNPNKNIYMVFVAKARLPIQDTNPSSKMVMELQKSYKNIYFVNLNYVEYVENTPVQDVAMTIVEKLTLHSYSYAEDILKLLTLWRFGGITLDLDVIVLKSLHKMPRNFLGAESDSRIGSAVMGFSSEEFGHEYVTKMLEEYWKTFILKSRGGSDFTTKIIKMICKETNTSAIIQRGCEAIKIYPSEFFYPIPWTNWTQLFDARENENVWKLIEKSFVVNFWGSRSFSKKLRVNSFAPYVDIARSFCPKVFNLMNDYL
ncbi:lactosylceramide 4-alpha-galactosyltransferase-like [Onthophagus taurus]|uniref:lactosylceramide 4-alpha-galactosyltransferase-like n=1 Tax=Onthophagus taurus TaxID=166361 RepID=UPI000C20C222|nr:lactosylceramide 4-alpha-galactosyltransferase-like [Onthophagus taurus]